MRSLHLSMNRVLGLRKASSELSLANEEDLYGSLHRGPSLGGSEVWDGWNMRYMEKDREREGLGGQISAPHDRLIY